MLFDSHSHYNDEKFDDDRDSLLSSMPENNVGLIMNACSSIEEIPAIIELTRKYPFVYGSVGVHPHEVENMTENDIEILRKYAADEKIKAIGEIGLDYFYDNSPRDLQKKWFAHQIELACELNLPIIVHDRDAHADTVDILKQCHAERCGGVFHCYSGSAEMAKEILNLGMYIAFGGSLTFKKSVKPKEAAAVVPLDRILTETDCPYLTPEPYRGKRNSSLYMYLVAEKLAEIKGVSVEAIENATYENAKRCFKIQ